MFYFEKYNGKEVLKSHLLKDVNHFFTTREGFDFSLIKDKRIVTPLQTHSDNIEFIDEKNEYTNTDGLIIKENNIGCYLKFADCTPLIFYDKKQKIGAVSHAGWRGTAQKIGVKTIGKMGSNPEDVVVIIGPAISICCYEVSEEVKGQLLSTINNKEGSFFKRNIDLKKINAQQLIEIGVKNIDICPYCTSCDNDKFFSYRKENGTLDRHYACLIL